jgi:copper chaperone CopZ
MENVGCCANCAARMERAVARIDGVRSASVSFLARRLTLDADDAAFDAIVEQAGRACRRIEPACLLVR